MGKRKGKTRFESLKGLCIDGRIILICFVKKCDGFDVHVTVHLAKFL